MNPVNETSPSVDQKTTTPFGVIPQTTWRGMKVSDLTYAMEKLQEFSEERRYRSKLWYLPSIFIAAGSVVCGFVVHEGFFFGILTPAVFGAYWGERGRNKPLTAEQKEANEIVREYKEIPTDEDTEISNELLLRLFPFIHSPNPIRSGALPLSFNQLRTIHETITQDVWESFFTCYQEGRLLNQNLLSTYIQDRIGYRDLSRVKAHAYQVWRQMKDKTPEELEAALLYPDFHYILWDPSYQQAFLLHLTEEQLSYDPLLELICNQFPINWGDSRYFLTPSKKKEAILVYIKAIRQGSSIEEANQSMLKETLRLCSEDQSHLPLDLTIDVAGVSFLFNRQWLIKESGYFEKILNNSFQEHTEQNRIVLHNEEQKEDLILLTEYFQQTGFTIHEERIPTLIKFADYYGINRLMTICENFLERSYAKILPQQTLYDLVTAHYEPQQLDTFNELVTLTYRYNLLNIQEKILAYFQKSVKPFFPSYEKALLTIKQIDFLCSHLPQDFTTALQPWIREQLAKTLSSENFAHIWEKYSNDPTSIQHQACLHLGATNSKVIYQAYRDFPPPDLIREIDVYTTQQENHS